MEVHFNLNGEDICVHTEPNRRLLDVLREDLQLTGTKEGCGEGECGTCTVLLDGNAVHACMILIGQMEGHSLTTIEGLARNGELDVLQKAFVDNEAIQCGFCTPGMIMSARGLLLKNPDPTEQEIRNAISGNICRCSGYEQIIAAILEAAAVLRGENR